VLYSLRSPFFDGDFTTVACNREKPMGNVATQKNDELLEAAIQFLVLTVSSVLVNEVAVIDFVQK